MVSGKSWERKERLRWVAVAVSLAVALCVGTDRPAAAAPSFTGLGDLPGGSFESYAYGVSGDGSVVVGSSQSASGSEAFRWTSGGGMVGLGYLPSGPESTASGVSGDGSVVVGGQSTSGPPGPQALRWTSGGGMVGLGDLPGGEFNSAARGVSGDGSVVVGFGSSASGQEAFRWTSGGGMVGLGDFPGGSFESYANGVSGDGAVVVGLGNSASGKEAFIWDPVHGMRSLQNVLVTDYALDLTGWNLDEALAISSDGSTVVGVGTHAGNREAWVAVIPEPASGALFGLGLVVLAVRRRSTFPYRSSS